MVVGAPVITFSAPQATLLGGPITLSATAAVVTFTAPAADIVIGGSAFDYLTDRNGDWNTAMRWALADRYTIPVPLDIAAVYARFQNEYTDEDSTRAYKKLERICQGLDAPSS